MANIPEPPSRASPLYKALFKTAISFIAAQALDQTYPSRMNFDAIRSVCASGFTHSWGHNYAVAQAPALQGDLDIDGFIAHLQSMLPKLESWEMSVTDVVVDELRQKVVLRISFWMRAKGVQEEDRVENDLLWVLEMGEGETEEGKMAYRIRRSVEFVDGVAAGRLREVMMRGKK